MSTWRSRSGCRPRPACAACVCWRRAGSSGATSPCSTRPKVGLPVSVFVQVTLERQVETALQGFEEAVVKQPEVMECYLMTGDADYLLRVVAADLEAISDFCSTT